MSPTLTTFLFEAANFLVLAGALGWLFFNPVRQALDERRGKLAQQAQQTAAALAQAQATQQEIELARDQLHNELKATRASELAATRAEADQLLADTRVAGERELTEMRRQAAGFSDTEQQRLTKATLETAAEIVGQLLAQFGGPNLHQLLLTAACNQLRELSSAALAPVTVESAHELSDDERAAINQALGAAAATTDYRSAPTWASE